MKLENLRIIVDERERKSGIPDLLKSVGLNLEMKTLPIGDYIVAPETVVERKTISDLVSSIFDGRLFDQSSPRADVFFTKIQPLYLCCLLSDNLDVADDFSSILFGRLPKVRFVS